MDTKERDFFQQKGKGTAVAAPVALKNLTGGVCTGLSYFQLALLHDTEHTDICGRTFFGVVPLLMSSFGDERQLSFRKFKAIYRGHE